jgi:hypothetical protein
MRNDSKKKEEPKRTNGFLILFFLFLSSLRQFLVTLSELTNAKVAARINPEEKADQKTEENQL